MDPRARTRLAPSHARIARPSLGRRHTWPASRSLSAQPSEVHDDADPDPPVPVSDGAHRARHRRDRVRRRQPRRLHRRPDAAGHPLSPESAVNVHPPESVALATGETIRGPASASQGAPRILPVEERDMVETATRIVNKPAWVDLGTSDAAAARAFYSKVFGW